MSSDIPAPVALILLSALLGILYGWHVFSLYDIKLEHILDVLELHLADLLVLTLSVTINFTFISLLLRRLLKLTKQGSRLKKMLSDESTPHLRFKKSQLLIALSALAVFISAFEYINSSFLGLNEWQIPSALSQKLVLGVKSNIALSALVFYLMLTRLRFINLFLKRKFVLPPFPKIKNAIVLGSVGEQ